MTMTLDEIERIRREIWKLRAERAAWRTARFAVIEPLLGKRTKHDGIDVSVDDALREQIIEGVETQISYCEDVLTRLAIGGRA